MDGPSADFSVDSVDHSGSATKQRINHVNNPRNIKKLMAKKQWPSYH
jgi:hypothetical protein